MKKVICISMAIIGTTIGTCAQTKEILITKNPAEVEGLERLGEISSASSIPFAGQKKLRKKAKEKVMEQAKNLKADIVLITVDNFAMTPINNVNMEGIAYKYPSTMKLEKSAMKDSKEGISINGPNRDHINWQDIIITKFPKEVEGLTRIKEYNVSASIPFGGQKKLRKNAREKLRKEASRDSCEIVLLHTDEFSMSPINTINLVGVGYRKE